MGAAEEGTYFPEALRTYVPSPRPFERPREREREHGLVYTSPCSRSPSSRVFDLAPRRRELAPFPSISGVAEAGRSRDARVIFKADRFDCRTALGFDSETSCR